MPIHQPMFLTTAQSPTQAEACYLMLEGRKCYIAPIALWPLSYLFWECLQTKTDLFSNFPPDFSMFFFISFVFLSVFCGFSLSVFIGFLSFFYFHFHFFLIIFSNTCWHYLNICRIFIIYIFNIFLIHIEHFSKYMLSISPMHIERFVDTQCMFVKHTLNIFINAKIFFLLICEHFLGVMIFLNVMEFLMVWNIFLKIT